MPHFIKFENFSYSGLFCPLLLFKPYICHLIRFSQVIFIFRKKQAIDRNLVKHFKQIQEQELLNWRGKGINIKFTSRPGMGDSSNQTGLGPMNTDYNESGQLNLPKKKNSIFEGKANTFNEEKKQYAKIEEKRFQTMLDLLLKHREWEEERLKVQLMQGSNEIQINGDEYNHNLQQFVNSIEQYASLSANV